uniref:Ig-like domain-containing protein n=1 Tax=Oreochromis aureus TaxID=47969 RepID=A0A668V9S7_OREAU
TMVMLWIILLLLHQGCKCAFKFIKNVLDCEFIMCPRDYNVFWFRPGSDQLHPSIIYTDGNRHSESEIISDSQERCLYRFSKNVSSSDAGTYYCAVATCGEILFGNGTKLDIEGILLQPTQSEFIRMAILIVCLAISLFGNVVLICNRRVCKPFQGKCYKKLNLFKRLKLFQSHFQDPKFMDYTIMTEVIL